ncbi:hypothetical protein IJE86_06605 [bacterium]|nr:hypothetical protein [bacterium]
MSVLNGAQIFQLIDSKNYTEEVDERALIKEMNREINGFLNVINDMENNILLSVPIFPN